jgi:Fe-S cluster assembly protein SufD
MMDTMQVIDKDHFLTQFDRLENQLAGSDLPWVRDLRKQAFARFEELGLPRARSEDWRFTNVSAIAKQAFQIPAEPDVMGITSGKLKRAEFVDPGLGALNVFVNGHFAERFSIREGAPRGVFFSNLADALNARPNNPLADKIEPYLARQADFRDQPFIALNTAFFQDGGFILIPPDTVVPQPIYLIFVTGPGKTLATQPRNLIVVGKNSRLQLVEIYLGLEDNRYFTNAVTEIVAGEGSVIDHYKLQRESLSAYHIAATQVNMERGSNFKTHYLSLGCGLVRNEVRIRFDGEGSEATVNGLYLAGGSQHIDNFTVIDHAQPRCASHELYKGILDDKAHGVFNGKIFVRQDAQKTDAKQTNKVLLLSEDATINTKPQLEIFADDVKCTHGATVGQLDAESLFYLRSRGIGLAEARGLLTFAFANDIISRIEIEPLRARMERQLMTRHFNQGPQVPESI